MQSTVVNGDVQFCACGMKDVEVTIDNEKYGKVTVKTDDAGKFVFNEVWSGDYSLSVLKEGYSFTPALKSISVGASTVETVFDASVKWSKVFTGENRDRAFAIHPAPECGYVIAGMRMLGSEEMTDALVMHVNKFGEVVWEETYGGAFQDAAYAITFSDEEGFVIAGKTEVAGRQDQLYVRKILSDGSKQWDYTFDGPEDDGAYAIGRVESGNYYVAGYTTDTAGDRKRDILVVKLSSEGSCLSHKTYGGNNFDEARALVVTQGGDVIIAGSIRNVDGSDDGWVLKLDKDGNELWEKTYGGIGDDVIYSIKETSDGGYVFAGYTDSTGAGGNDMWMVKLAAGGEIQWEKTYGGVEDDIAYALTTTTEGGYVLTGMKSPVYSTEHEAVVMRLDANADQVWERSFSSAPESDNAGYALMPAPDGGFAMTGKTTSYEGLDDIIMLKIDADGWYE